jgi:hypothetical protein
MIQNGKAFLGQIPLVMGQQAPSLPVTAEQFHGMSTLQRSEVLNTLSPQQACQLYTQLYSLTNDSQDEQFMKSWCKVSAG